MTGAEPLCWEEDGKAMGIEVEIAEYLVTRLGLEFEPCFYPWTRAQIMLRDGDIDCIITTPTDKRWEIAAFGREMALPNYWNIFISKNNIELIEKSKNFTGIEDLKPYSIADYLGDGWAAQFMSDGYRINYLGTIEQMIKHTASGRSDMIINSSLMINWWIDKLGLSSEMVEIDTDNFYFTRFSFVVMVSRKSQWYRQGLLKSLDIELKKMKENGDFLEMLEKYNHRYVEKQDFNDDYLNTERYYIDYESYPVLK